DNRVEPEGQWPPLADGVSLDSNVSKMFRIPRRPLEMQRNPRRFGAAVSDGVDVDTVQFVLSGAKARPDTSASGDRSGLRVVRGLDRVGNLRIWRAPNVADAKEIEVV